MSNRKKIDRSMLYRRQPGIGPNIRAVRWMDNATTKSGLAETTQTVGRLVASWMHLRTWDRAELSTEFICDATGYSAEVVLGALDELQSTGLLATGV